MGFCVPGTEIQGTVGTLDRFRLASLGLGVKNFAVQELWDNFGQPPHEIHGSQGTIWDCCPMRFNCPRDNLIEQSKFGERNIES